MCDLDYEFYFSNKYCTMQDSPTRQLIGTSRKVGCLFKLGTDYLSWGFFFDLVNELFNSLIKRLINNDMY